MYLTVLSANKQQNNGIILSILNTLLLCIMYSE